MKTHSHYLLFFLHSFIYTFEFVYLNRFNKLKLIRFNSFAKQQSQQQQQCEWYILYALHSCFVWWCVRLLFLYFSRILFLWKTSYMGYMKHNNTSSAAPTKYSLILWRWQRSWLWWCLVITAQTVKPPTERVECKWSRK